MARTRESSATPSIPGICRSETTASNGWPWKASNALHGVDCKYHRPTPAVTEQAPRKASEQFGLVIHEENALHAAHPLCSTKCSTKHANGRKLLIATFALRIKRLWEAKIASVSRATPVRVLTRRLAGYAVALGARSLRGCTDWTERPGARLSSARSASDQPPVASASRPRDPSSLTQSQMSSGRRTLDPRPHLHAASGASSTSRTFLDNVSGVSGF
jgi:hypothetical protein